MFILNVGLHDVPDSKSREIYDYLHSQLAARGFKRTIVATDQQVYRLPHSTYIFHGSGTAENVRILASAGANATGYPSNVIAFEYTGSAAWVGLELATMTERLLDV